MHKAHSHKPTFRPPPWLRNKHSQTIGSVIFPRKVVVFPSEDRRFTMHDGTQLTAECTWQDGDTESTITLLLVHGMNGSTISSYMRGVAAKAYQDGFNVIRLNMRNNGSSEELSKTLNHAGRSSDFVEVINELITADKVQRLGIITFSFSSNAMLRALAEWGDQAPKEIIGMVGISPVIDLAATADQIDHHAPRIYRWQLLRLLCKVMERREELHPGSYNLKELQQVTTFRGFDEIVSRHNGFDGADDYYRKTSVLPLLSQVRLPTLLIESLDDPVVPAASFEKIDNPNIRVELTRYGGHAGFITRMNLKYPDAHWAEQRAINYFQNIGKSASSE